MGLLSELSKAWSYVVKPFDMRDWVDAVSSQLDTLIADGQEVLIFRPGEPNPTSRVFASWSALIAQAQASPNPKTIIFDDSLAACVIPSGAWDFGAGCVFRGILPALNSLSPNRVSITCDNTVTFVTPLYEASDVNIQYSGTGALMTIPGDGKNRVFYGSRNARFTASSAGGSIFKTSAGTIWTAVLLDLATIVVSGGGFFATFDAGMTSGGLRVVESGSTAVRLPANALSGGVGPAYSFIVDVSGVASATQGSMPGGVITLTFVSGAPNLPYTPTTAAQWGPTPPTLVQGALDNQRGGVGPEFFTFATVGNLAGGGAIGTAANTVDQFRGANCAQTTAGQTLSLPNPTTATANQRFVVCNTGSQSFTMLGATVAAGGGLTAVWTGAAWTKLS